MNLKSLGILWVRSTFSTYSQKVNRRNKEAKERKISKSFEQERFSEDEYCFCEGI